MKWINFVKQPPKESGRYFVKGCHLPGQFEWDGEYLIDWRGEPLEDIDEDIEYLDESPSSDPAESKGNETIWEEMINKHIKPMYGSLEAASIKHFIEKGTVNGSFRLRLIAMMKFYELRVCKADPAEVLVKALKKVLNPDYTQSQKQWAAEDALKQYEQLKQQ